jgi:hypothetical protein
MRARRFQLAFLLTALAVMAIPACRRTLFDIVTNERVVRGPRSNKTQFTIDSRVELSTTLGTDKTVDSSTLNLTATNLHPDNPVTVDLSIAEGTQPGLFRPLIRFDLDPGETRDLQVVQTEPDDALVRAAQAKVLIIRFDSTSPVAGIGELEFRFKVRVLAHKETPGTGAGTLLFY